VAVLVPLLLLAPPARAGCPEAGAFSIGREPSTGTIIGEAKLTRTLTKLSDTVKLPSWLLPALVICDGAPTPPSGTPPPGRAQLIAFLSAQSSAATCKIFPTRKNRYELASRGPLCSDRSVEEYLSRWELHLAAVLAVSIMDDVAQASPDDDRGRLKEAARAAHQLFALASKGLTHPTRPEAIFWQDMSDAFTKSATAVDKIFSAAAVDFLKDSP
jgi:hypothetical protein